MRINDETAQESIGDFIIPKKRIDMIYAQIKRGLKLHLVHEPGEGPSPDKLIPKGHVGLPICGQRVPREGYRMTINLPLRYTCLRCLKVHDSMRRRIKND